VLVHSWEIKAYRKALAALPDRVLRVLWMDNIWRGTARQWVGRLIAPRYLHPLFDVAMVPSDRSEFFAKRLGYGASKVIRGCTPADTETFSTTGRTGQELAAHGRFVTAMRLVHHKGADVLAEAYRGYRELVEEPWELHVVGIGPMATCFEGVPGVRMLGFLQPDELAKEMLESSCFINPSRLEPYAVVLQEAAACGLPIICTDFIGAAPTMVQDGYNGWVVPGGDAAALAAAMARMSTLPVDRLEAMSETSLAFAKRLSPAGWALNVHEEISRRLPR
jgi:glycosyltransferase involved in cell wall biosynthesis